MNFRERVNRLLDGMDRVRPVAIAAMPDDQELRVTTRRMIEDMERLKQFPAVSLDTYLWLARTVSIMLDVEHGALLKPDAGGEVPDASRQAVRAHIEQRKALLDQALLELEPSRMVVQRSALRLGSQLADSLNLLKATHQLDATIVTHLEGDEVLKGELQQLIAAFTPSMQAISTILDQVGEESPELEAARQVLEQELPDDAEAARSLLQQAREQILSAGNTLASASQKLNQTIQDQVEKLSSLTSRLKAAESEARNDPLTGLPNRRSLAEFLKRLGTKGFCFLIVDVDYFKRINDKYGHDIGDEVLQQLATILKDRVRESDLAARIGGEEFCVVFPETGLDNSAMLAEKLRAAIAAMPFQTSAGKIAVTASIGVAEHRSGTNHSETFKAADTALYQSKQHGRNRVTRA